MRYKHIAFLIAVPLGISVAPPTLADLNDGLVAAYPFDGNAQDASGNGHHGSVHGATLTADRFGNADSAYHFNGNGNDIHSIELPHTVTNGLIDITSSVWVQTSDADQGILSGANSGSENQYLIYMESGKVKPHIKQEPFSKGLINDGQWHHVVVARDGGSGQVQVFVDGDSVGSGTLPVGPLSIDAGGFWVGREQDCVGGCWEPYQDFLGDIDDIRIYNRVLSESEIKALYKGISGCTDSTATNYNPDATADDGSCESDQGDCQHASYNLKDRTLSIPFVVLPLLDVWTGQPTGEVELFKGVLKQKYKTTEHFRLLSKTVALITDGSSSSCPASYSFDTGVLSIPYINVPTTAAMGGNKFDSSKVEVFKATLTWEPQEKVFVVKEVEQRP